MENAGSEERVGWIENVPIPIMRVRDGIVIETNSKLEIFIGHGIEKFRPGSTVAGLLIDAHGKPWLPWNGTRDTLEREAASQNWQTFRLRVDEVGFRHVLARYVVDRDDQNLQSGSLSGLVYLLSDEIIPSLQHGPEATSEELNLALAHISHEFRTPLNAILGFSEIMCLELIGKLPETYHDYANDIHFSAEHLKRIVEQMLDIAKLARGQMALDEGFVSMREIVKRSMGILNGIASARGIEIQTNSRDELPSVYGDEGRLQQVFLNVIGNAVKFSQEGGRIQINHSEEDGNLTIWVRDQAGGMTEEEIERATLPFGRARAATRSDKEGTGLGLPISRWILEAHQGWLRIESVKGKGTGIGLTLPAARVVFPGQARTDSGSSPIPLLKLSDLANSSHQKD